MTVSKSVFFFLQILYNNIQHCQTVRILNKKISPLQSEIDHLKNQLRKCKCQVPIHKKLLITDEKSVFCTGFETYELFTKLHDFIDPFVKRRYHDYKNSLQCVLKLKRNFINSPKKMGQKRKLESKDEFLMMLMKLKLDALLKDIRDRFGISAAHCGRVCHARLL